MDSSLKICITGKFSGFAVRDLLSAGGPFIINSFNIHLIYVIFIMAVIGVGHSDATIP